MLFTSLYLPGAVQLAKEHDSTMTASDKYVRCAEEHRLSDGKIYRLIICMSVEMAHHLMNAKFLAIDTSFKRVQGQGWQEFEMESWNSEHMQCEYC